MITARESSDGSYLPARMLNEYVYCPRLFYYEHVEGVFNHNHETVEGAGLHSRVDAKSDPFPSPESLLEQGQRGKARSIQLSSDSLGIIAKLDMLETDGTQVIPVDYKRGKIRNQRTLLMRNHVEPPKAPLMQLKALQHEVQRCESLGELMGIEGNAAAIYFRHFAGMLKVDSSREEYPWGGFGDEPSVSPESEGTSGEKQEAGEPISEGLTFHFESRNRRPPRDPVNAMLSLAYALLAKDLMITCGAVGLDPYLGFLHQARYPMREVA